LCAKSGAWQATHEATSSTGQGESPQVPDRAAANRQRIEQKIKTKLGIIVDHRAAAVASQAKPMPRGSW
jgi:hypothetical protein